MTVCIREQLLAAITAAVVGQYGIPAPEDERDLPVTIVQEGRDEAVTRYGSVEVTTPVTVVRAEQSTSHEPAELRAQANELLAWIVTAVCADETFGGLAVGVDYVGGGIQSEVGKFVFAQASFSVRWRHAHGDPYQIEATEP